VSSQARLTVGRPVSPRIDGQLQASLIAKEQIDCELQALQAAQSIENLTMEQIVVGQAGEIEGVVNPIMKKLTKEQGSWSRFSKALQTGTQVAFDLGAFGAQQETEEEEEDADTQVAFDLGDFGTHERGDEWGPSAEEEERRGDEGGAGDGGSDPGSDSSGPPPLVDSDSDSIWCPVAANTETEEEEDTGAQVAFDLGDFRTQQASIWCPVAANTTSYLLERDTNLHSQLKSTEQIDGDLEALQPAKEEAASQKRLRLQLGACGSLKRLRRFIVFDETPYWYSSYSSYAASPRRLQRSARGSRQSEEAAAFHA